MADILLGLLAIVAGGGVFARDGIEQLTRHHIACDGSGHAQRFLQVVQRSSGLSAVRRQQAVARVDAGQYAQGGDGVVDVGHGASELRVASCELRDA